MDRLLKKRNFFATAANISFLPEDIMLGILSRLSVTSICQFKSVCKSWCHLFSTPEFIKLHRQQFSTDPKYQQLIVNRIFPQKSLTDTLSFFNIGSGIGDVDPTNFHHTLRDAYIVGCCNGLICLCCKETIVLLNPATMMLHKLEARDLILSLGFGWDAEADDFKVVRFFDLGKNDRGVEGVEVYSSSSGSWKRIEPGFEFWVEYVKNNTIVNGNPYWRARVYEGNNLAGEYHHDLVWFDVKEMVFRIVSLSGVDFKKYTLVNWKGSLGALVCDDNGEFVDVWVFDEEKWRKEITLGLPVGFKAKKFLECSKNGKVLVGKCKDGELFLLDAETRKVEVLFGGARDHKRAEIYPYTASLAFIQGMVRI